MFAPWHFSRQHASRIPVRLLVFDFTGTLARVHPDVGVQYASAARKAGFDYDADLLRVKFFDAFRATSSEWPNYGAAQGISTKDWCGTSEFPQ